MKKKPFEAIVIGASAGAVEALLAILPKLPVDYALPIVAVVHIPPDSKSLLPELLQPQCGLQVKEVDDKEPMKGGTIYIAPPDYHVLVENNKSLSLSNEEPNLFSRPSIDILFETAAEVYEDKLIGIILTGSNNDGAEGLRAIIEAGGTALIQRPSLAHAAGMPEASIKTCPSASVLGLDQIVTYLKEAV